ncbi:hypothetical protein MMC27_001838 [Xylographa pallens]|nr:hypothetical protein [Xylographa pallens]
MDLTKEVGHDGDPAVSKSTGGSQHGLVSRSKNNRLTELTTIISQNTAKLNDYFESAGVPTPSFDVSAPVDHSFPPKIHLLRESILDANTELRELLLGPRETMVEWQYNYYVPLHAVWRYKLAHMVPVQGEATFTQIAEKSGLDESLVRRLLRHAMANRIFTEVRKGVVAHTAMSRLLAEDPLFPDYVGVGCEEMLRAATYTVPAMLKFPNSEEPGHTGFAMANQCEDSAYEILAREPERAKRFMNCMAMVLTGPGYAMKSITDHDVWNKIPNDGTVVDVGGSHGETAVALAKKFPALELVVQDLQSTIDAHSQLPDDLAKRVRFMTHDFFTPQPVKDADIYFFRWIFHNWPDQYCLKILKNLVPALKEGARIVVNEWCLPEPNSVSNRLDRKMRGMDIGMLTIFNAQERDRDEWISLFKRADERFKFVSIDHPEQANLSIIQFQW